MAAAKGNQYALGNNGGPPTKYTPELEALAHAYLKDYEDVHGQAIPSAVGLAKILNVAQSTVYKWAEENDKELSDILGKLKDLQHETLVSKGLKGEFNSTITKLILTKHGYSDKQEIKADVNDYSALEGDELDRKIIEMQQKLDKSRED